MRILSALFLCLSLCMSYAIAFSQTHISAATPADFVSPPSILSTQDGGKISINTTKKSYGKGMGDFLLTKTNKAGNEEWFNSYGGTSYDLSSSLAITRDGGYILIGSTSSFGAGNYDIYVIKTDAYGKEEWSQTYGGFPNEYGQKIWQKENGNYLIAASRKRYITEAEIAKDPKLVWTFTIDKKGKELK